MTARSLAAIVFLLIPSLAPAQTTQMQGNSDLARNEAGRPSPSENSGNASDGNGAATPTNKEFDEASDANAVTAHRSRLPLCAATPR